MIEQYFRLDVSRFYHDFRGNEKLLAELIAEKQSAAYGSGDSGEPRVDGGLPGNPTESRAFKRMSLDKRIARVREYFELEQKIYMMLSDEEKLIADMMKRGKDMNAIADKLCLSESHCRVKVSNFKRRVQELVDWV